METVTPIRITLREAREAAGLTQVELAKRAGVRQATISDMETGKRGSIELRIIERICATLACQVEDLIRYDPDKPTRRKR